MHSAIDEQTKEAIMKALRFAREVEISIIIGGDYCIGFNQLADIQNLIEKLKFAYEDVTTHNC